MARHGVRQEELIESGDSMPARGPAEPLLCLKTHTPACASKVRSIISKIARNLRTSEKLVLFYFAYSTLEAMVFPVSFLQRIIVPVLNAVAAFVVTLVARLSTRSRRASSATSVSDNGSGTGSCRAAVAGVIDPHGSQLRTQHRLLAVIRDWFPAVLILLAYREAGLYCLPDLTHHLDYTFVRWDNLLLHSHAIAVALSWGRPWLQRYLEICYTLCYPLVPLGLGALYAIAQRPALAARGEFDPESAFDQYWTAVLLALFTCYALFPFFPLMPPRVLFHDLSASTSQPVFRHLNLWILEHYGIESSVFPSGHVAAVTAVSLCVRHYWRRAGIVFLILAFSIGLATIVGRYHYAADSITGAMIGALAFTASKRFGSSRQHVN